MRRARFRSDEDATCAEEGATLAELAVALVVASIVVLICYGVYAGASRAARVWSERRRLEAAALTIERRLAGDFRAAMRLDTVASGYRLTGADSTVHYRLGGGRLLRDGRPSVRDSLLSITLVMHSDTTEQPVRFEARLQLVRRQDTLQARIVAASRAVAPAWQSAPPQPR